MLILAVIGLLIVATIIWALFLGVQNVVGDEFLD